MTSEIPFLVIVLKTITLLIGGFITYTAFSAARKSGWKGLTYLAAGFGIVTFGSLLAGVGDQLLLFSTHNALIAENALTAIGFAVIAYSLYVTQ
ncbi:hypothetical protein AUR64_14455 [Haloprofundus marisrubri]|uniref:Uncharacterized protein n=1 Tax=Haloprofundus marisrubri TaxID=1514971 RepID=A0A0W1R6F8_9EURY|nr:hypothetical protein [Haloprofundus marisrubri]KTG09003.1 hypothetical protein AUR64_14455 [Haloprofundus marisrubri]